MLWLPEMETIEILFMKITNRNCFCGTLAPKELAPGLEIDKFPQYCSTVVQCLALLIHNKTALGS